MIIKTRFINKCEDCNEFEDEIEPSHGKLTLMASKHAILKGHVVIIYRKVYDGNIRDVDHDLYLCEE